MNCLLVLSTLKELDNVASHFFDDSSKAFLKLGSLKQAGKVSLRIGFTL
jgi:hypothetical protein